MKIRLLHTILLLLSGYFANAQDISLYQQFNGRYDFTFVGNTLNPAENNPTATCTINTSSSEDLNLNPDDEVIAAYLYWAGSGFGDFDIKLNGTDITAERDFPLMALNTDGQTRAYFSAFADVTDLVQATGNGTYTVSELDLTAVVAEQLYCGIKTNFGGWAIIVFYYNPNLPLNQLNLYDGLQYVPTAINITLPSLNVIDNVGAKIGFLAWEGDSSLAVSETLSINGNPLSNALNPVNNAFNGTNSVTGSNTLYNMDLDIYDIQNNINIGDETADITLQSGQDFVMINAIVTKLNSQLPDATITIDNATTSCNAGFFEVSYTVYNTNSTDILPAGTPITFYADGQQAGSAVTVGALPIGGSESGTAIITVPAGTPQDFELLAVVDDQGNGQGGIVTETDEENNFFILEVSQILSPPLPAVIPNVIGCDDGSGLAVFDFSGYEESLKTEPEDVVTFYNSEADAGVPQNPITDSSAFQSTSNPQEIFVRVVNEEGCVSIGSFLLVTDDCLYPDGTIVINNLDQNCDSRTITLSYTVNNFDSQDILPAGTPIAIYNNGILVATAATLADIPIGGSESDTVTATIPGSNLNLNITIVVDDTGNGQGIETETDETNNAATLSGTLFVSPVITEVLPDLTECETDNGTNVGVFDFSAYIALLQNNPDDIVTFHTSQNDANTGDNDIADPSAYISDGNNPQTIYVRLENENGCYDTTSFTLTAIDCLFPDATITIADIILQCDSRIVTVEYTVNNFNSFDILPGGLPISIYVNGTFLEYAETILDIPIGGSESSSITLVIPDEIPLNFDLLFVADDIGDGIGIVVETDETNNSDSSLVSLPLSPGLQQPESFVSCNLGFELGIFDFSAYEETLKTQPGDTVYFYASEADANQDSNRIFNTSAYNSTTNPQEIFVRVDNQTCYSLISFMLSTKKCPPTTYNYVTPNGDGYNDAFFVEGLRNIFFNFKMSIYNRWGSLVWTGNHSTADWDGIASVDKVGPEGNTVPVGTYYFVLELNDPEYPEPIVGWVYVTK
ncbi:gliding motility-associated C-terminal domain-containing protein [Flavobacterium coralii]|uniref:T9SS type B sorting domain-containing protein n=1 Tax=Flavobacterium coralii TaxID=2838017 RepID=UPI000C545C93|nr:hypothetical protein [Flavobacterium sp.]